MTGGKVDSYLGAGSMITVFITSALTIALYNMPLWARDYSITGPRATNKPYKSFGEFYPFYLSEHANITNRRIHLIGTTLSLLVMIVYPDNFLLMFALAAGCFMGALASNLFAGHRHGIIEGVIMIGTFLFLASINGQVKYAFVRYH